MNGICVVLALFLHYYGTARAFLNVDTLYWANRPSSLKYRELPHRCWKGLLPMAACTLTFDGIVVNFLRCHFRYELVDVNMTRNSFVNSEQRGMLAA